MRKLNFILLLLLPAFLSAQVSVGNQWEKAQVVFKGKHQVKELINPSVPLEMANSLKSQTSYAEDGSWVKTARSAYPHKLEKQYGEETFYRNERNSSIKLIAFDGFVVLLTDEEYRRGNPNTVIPLLIFESGKFRPDNFYKQAVDEYFIAYHQFLADMKNNAQDLAAKKKAEDEANLLAEQTKNSTKGVQIKSLTVTSDKKSMKLFASGQLSVTATATNGTVYKTEDAGGKVNFDFNYTVKAPQAVTMGKDGKFTISNPEKIVNDELVFEVADKFKPEVKQTVKIALDYKDGQYVSRAGDAGGDGSQPSTYKENCRIYKGDPGTNASAGRDGKTTEVYIEEAKNSKTGEKYYKVRVNTKGSTVNEYYIVSAGNKVTIDASGGNGGEGGRGGNGSDISNRCQEKRRGDLGVGGNGGNGGRGGDIYVYTSSSAIDYKQVLDIMNNGGTGGQGGEGVPAGSNGANGRKGSIYPTVQAGLKAFN